MPDDRITFIINNLSENLNVEVKNWLNGLQSNDDKSTLAKEIIALVNNGGGDIFIGFHDQGEGHPEIPPQQGELEAFFQDTVASLVESYAEPPCQCSVGYYRRVGSVIDHPEITVPSGHRTPVWARRGSPDGQTLQTGTVYVRRPGGASETARTQDDWEKVLDRLVRARQTDLLDAIRDVLNPPENVVRPEENLDDWYDECHGAYIDGLTVRLRCQFPIDFTGRRDWEHLIRTLDDSLTIQADRVVFA